MLTRRDFVKLIGYGGLVLSIPFSPKGVKALPVDRDDKIKIDTKLWECSYISPKHL